VKSAEEAKAEHLL